MQRMLPPKQPALLPVCWSWKLWRWTWITPETSTTCVIETARWLRSCSGP